MIEFPLDLVAPVTSALTRLKRVEHPASRYLLLRGRGLLHYARRGHSVRRRIIEAYLAASDEPCLHFGAGPKRIEGWLNSDLIAGDVYLDLGRPLPFPDGGLAYMFGEHVFGCLSEPQAMAMLSEAHRVLRPGGVLRLTTPDLEKLIALYRDENPVVRRDDYIRYLEEETGKPARRRAQMLNDLLRLWSIRYTYDEEDLVAKLREAGFVEVQRVEPGESAHAALKGVERHGDPWVNRAEALCIEATRP
jgi:predicted SAM-dependent methyltransferase